METIGAYQAKTHLSNLLERVAQGDEFIITRHGVPVAILIPYDPEKRVDVGQVIADLHHFRSQHKLEGLTIKELIAAGRR